MRIRAQLSPVELLVHLPFVKQLLEFGVRPLRELPFSELSGLTAEDITDEPQLELDLDVRLQQADVVLVNHVLGPSMPLLKLHLQAALLHVAMRRDGSRLRTHVHLPLDAKAYNARAKAYDTCLEPAIVGIHVAIEMPWRFEDLDTRLKHEHLSVGLCSSPLYATITQELARSVM